MGSRHHDIGALRVTSNKSLVVRDDDGGILIYLTIIIYIHYVHSLRTAYIDILWFAYITSSASRTTSIASVSHT